MDNIVAIPLPGQPPGPGGDRSSCPALAEFVTGPENRLVEPAVRCVLEAPSNGCNLVLFCGPSGTGKSHLAGGLTAAWKALHPRRKALYTTAADFTRELADAMDTQATDELRNRYREAGLVVVDNIDGLAGEYDAQEELVQTLDALLAAGSRVVLTASVAPARLAGVMPRLQGRLDSGLTVPLAPPGPGARLAVIQRFALLRKLDLSQSAAQTLADGLAATVPELLDVLRQLEMSARPRGGRIDGHHARRWLASGNGSREVRLPEVLAATARVFGVRPSQLRSRSRRQAVVTARTVAMYLARQLTTKSLQQVGRYFGGRDHSTVMYGCRKAEKLLDSDPAVRWAIQQLQEKLRKG